MASAIRPITRPSAPFKPEFCFLSSKAGVINATATQTAPFWGVGPLESGQEGL